MLAFPQEKISDYTTGPILQKIQQPYYKYTTNIPQYTTKHHNSITKNTKMWYCNAKNQYFTTKCNTLPHYMVLYFSQIILPQIVVFYYKIYYFTTQYSILPQTTIFYHNSFYQKVLYFLRITLPQNVVFNYKI